MYIMLEFQYLKHQEGVRTINTTVSKVVSVEEAISHVHDGDTVLVNGFYGYGSGSNLMKELIAQGQRDLTIVANDGGMHGYGIGPVVDNGQARKVLCTWCGSTPSFSQLSADGSIELELCPQGSFAERIRAGGFGLGGILTPTGLGTVVEENWGERVHLNGKDWLYQAPIRGNVTLLEAWRADESGNLIFKHTQRNFATAMAYASDLVIASVVNPIEPAGSFDPDEIMVPGIVVDMLVQQKGENRDDC